MPCRDVVLEEQSDREYDEKNAKIEAVLCGVFRSLGDRELDKFLDGVDWKAAGVTRKWVMVWWKAHKRKDDERILLEERERNKARIYDRAVAKLTDEEKEALGVY